MPTDADGRVCIKCKVLRPESAFASPKTKGCVGCARDALKAQVEARKAEKDERKLKRSIRRAVASNLKGSIRAQRKVQNEKKKARTAEERKKRAAERREAAKEAKLKAALAENTKQILKNDPATKELALRELCRRRLVHFIKRFNRKYRPGWVHELICARLEQFMADVAAQKAPRLMIFMPPRHGKSEIASKNFPAWMLGHHPEWEIIASSYAVSLPIGFSRRVRGLIKDSYYRSLFPQTVLDPSSQAAETWATTKGGGYVAAGVGGGITGKGAHVFIIDDPVKDASEADSETLRDSAWDWYGSTAKTRLSPGGGMLVIQTRWHDDDLSGRLLSQMTKQLDELKELIVEAEKRLEEAKTPDERAKSQVEIENLKAEMDDIDQWEVITFPAIATYDEVLDPDQRIVQLEDVKNKATRAALDAKKVLWKLTGQSKPMDAGYGWQFLRAENSALHEDRFPIGRLRNMKRSLQARHWSALYQQNPVPDEGVYFRKEMFRFEPVTPDTRLMKKFIACDLAMSKRERADWSVFSVGALDYDDQLHLIDVIRVKQDTNDLVETLLTLVRKYRPEMTGIEKGQYEIAIKPQLNKRMREERMFFTLAEGDYALKPIQDKETRARPLQGRMQQGMVLFPENQPWMEGVQYELLRFPGGVHDDIVDSLAWLARLVMMHEPPKPQKRVKLKSWKDKLRANTRQRHPMGA